ncbi:MAG TPA: hypothetical protein VH256_02270 [Thermoleophilaceae bacterium]|jgi:hypothetical protein|nr:hypothetical protein [Thermoleophilaceae bacterium]
MATPKERADQKRQDKLDEVQRQVDAGTLKVRKMTAAERRENPPKPRPQRGRR